MKAYIFLFIFLSLFTAGTVLAQEAVEIAEEEIITLSDLEVEDPGMLPTSPFYFFKEMGRGIQNLLTFNSVKKAELQLQYSNEKAAELKKVEEDHPENAVAIERALRNYERSQNGLKKRLERLQETSENPKVDRLLDKVVQKIVVHEKLFEEIGRRHESKKEVQSTLSRVRERIEESAGEAVKKDSPEKLKLRFEKVFEEGKGGEFKHLRSIEILDRVRDKAPEAAREHLDEVREKLAIQVQAKIVKLAEQGEEEVRMRLKNIPGDEVKRAAFLEEVRISAPVEVSEALQTAKSVIEEDIGDSQFKEKVETQMKGAIEKLEKLQKAAAEKDDPTRTIARMIAQIQEDLALAREAVRAEEYRDGFKYAHEAEVLARRGLHFLSGEQENIAEVLKRVERPAKKDVSGKDTLRKKSLQREKDTTGAQPSLQVPAPGAEGIKEHIVE